MVARHPTIRRPRGTRAQRAMQPNDRKFTPLQAIDAWPADRPLAALVPDAVGFALLPGMSLDAELFRPKAAALKQDR